MHEDLFIDALAENPSALSLRAEKLIISLAKGKAVVPCRNLAVEQFSRMNHCNLSPDNTPRAGFCRYWGGEEFDQLYTSYDQVTWSVNWNDHSLAVVHLQWENGCGGDHRDWVMAESVEIAEAFILDVSRKTHAPGEAILVFSGGRWNRSEALYNATQSASFEDLVLADDLKATIRDDFNSFLQSEDRYMRLGISWRRGALLIGPPGNGKTHCVRALVKELSVSSLYVQSLSHQYYTPEQMWQQVFERARGLRPCVLVLEDLDSLVTDENRSFFLNQLDGFEQNHGLIVLATTNHPDRIDAAIIDRPSRFDRKYHFNLPDLAERVVYLKNWQEQLASETNWSNDEVEPIAIACDGFSFAYLKELVISSVMKWMHNDSDSFASIMASQASTLGGQMKTEATAEAQSHEQSRSARHRR
jgi:AAA+ superfamily predicted ATPase